MSKSLIFCKETVSNPSRSKLTDRDWDKAVEHMETETFFDSLTDSHRSYRISGTDENGEQIELDIELEFNPDADFDYFTYDYCHHDGTLIFIKMTMTECAQRVITGQTYYKNGRKPKSGDTIKYTIGNFVFLNEYGKQFSTEEKPWMLSRTTVLLPLKVEING